MTQPFDHLVFDLDDTLLDTYRQLVPRASRDACQAMIDAGLNTDLDQCMKFWLDHARSHSRHEVFAQLAARFGTKDGADSRAVAKRGYNAFYNRRVESDISLFPGVADMLSTLGAKYTLHLVTSGTRATQEDKINLLQIRSMFDSIHHVDPTLGQRKRDAFSSINAQTGLKPERHLSIGNRVDTDVGEARAIGWKACLVRYGEHVNMLPMSDIEKPDFVIDRILELPNVCRL